MKALIADDHALFREGTRHALTKLADDIDIVEASNVAEALEAVKYHDDIALTVIDLASVL